MRADGPEVCTAGELRLWLWFDDSRLFQFGWTFHDTGRRFSDLRSLGDSSQVGPTVPELPGELAEFTFIGTRYSGELHMALVAVMAQRVVLVLEFKN